MKELYISALNVWLFKKNVKLVWKVYTFMVMSHKGNQFNLLVYRKDNKKTTKQLVGQQNNFFSSQFLGLTFWKEKTFFVNKQKWKSNCLLVVTHSLESGEPNPLKGVIKFFFKFVIVSVHSFYFIFDK